MKTFIKKYKKDILCITLLTISILVAIFILTIGKYYGDTNDWLNQHIMFPDYFRKLFYQTKNLFPEFAANIGAGQNIYNFSYYGFLSPVILPSYFMPWVSMIDYIIISNILLLIISGILMYIFLMTNFKSRSISFTGAFLFMFAGPILLHFHRHLMFVNYMPFLILGLMGIDIYFKKNKTLLFLVSTFLMIMTSYYYSIGGLITLAIYGVYKIFSQDKVTIKSFLYHTIRLFIPVIIAIMLSGVLLLPTIISLLSSRSAEITKDISIISLLKPNLSLGSLLYGTYNVGAIGLSVFALTSSFFIKEKNTKILNLLLTIIILFPIIQYILNGALYVRAKVLIPFLPLFIYSNSIFLKNIIERKINLKNFTIAIVAVLFIVYQRITSRYFYIETILLLGLIYLYYNNKKKEPLFIAILLISAFVGVTNNIATDFVTKEKRKEVISSKLSSDIKKISKNDDTYYHFGNYLNASLNFNHIYDISYKTTSVYSSAYNDYYKNFNDNIIKNSRPTRNSLNLATTPNIFMSMLMNHKYVISKQSILGYKKLEEYENIYVNENVLPSFYVSNNLISSSTFKKLSYPYNLETILNNTIVEENKDYKEKIKDTNIEEVNIYDYFDLKKLKATVEDGKYILEFNKNKKITLNAKQPIKNKIVIITFDLLNKQKCTIGDQSIIINGTGNKKTCSSWVYYNSNENFSYVFSKENIKKAEIIFSKGKYVINNIHMYMMDYNDIKDINKRVTEVKIDTKKSVDNKIIGNVTVNKDNSYFVSSIPYDDNFVVKVDGKKVKPELVNTSFLGFKIDKGNHKIELTYKAPLRNAGIITTIIGIIMAFSLVKVENKKNKKNYQ